MSDSHSFVRPTSLLFASAILFGACATNTTNNDESPVDPGDPFSGNPPPDGGLPGVDSGSGDDTGTTPPAAATSFTATLVPNGVTGMQRVNFAIPLAAGALTDANQLRITAGTTDLPAARRALATYSDGSLMSVQVQVDVDVTANPTLTVDVGVAGATGVTMAPVETTTTGTGNAVRPKVWVKLPASVLAASTVFGPVVPQTEVAGTALDAWSTHCDYNKWNTTAFLAGAADREVWLFDRATAMYRGYAITGDLSPLESAYREASLYRGGMTITNGVTTNIAVPTAQADLKYHYSQGMALHYLLTGDDRFREAAEAVSARVAGMFNPAYNGADQFWTERHAGFALLAHEWAARVTDDQSAAITARANTAVTAYLATQVAQRYGQSTDTSARCFAHTANAHGESYGTNGCSPWMSAILADGLDAHARRVGGARAAEVRVALGRLAKIVARDGRDSTGRPLYWMGVGGSGDVADDLDEHWGESAYVVALGWASTGKTDAALRTAADQLITGLRTRGAVGRVRSFNWQCRSGVMTPALLH
jgi:hypothetical protein